MQHWSFNGERLRHWVGQRCRDNAHFMSLLKAYLPQEKADRLARATLHKWYNGTHPGDAYLPAILMVLGIDIWDLLTHHKLTESGWTTEDAKRALN